MHFYYDNENNVYRTHYEALVATSTGKSCGFYYYDKELSSIDWTIYPSESLKTLYKNRAQQIRDEYEHVIVCYSGGTDSTNVLENFYYNNIHIDEILVVGAISQDKVAGSNENRNAEIYLNAYPLFNKLNLSNTKITVFDYTSMFDKPYQFNAIKEYGADWVKVLGTHTSAHNLFWYDVNRLIATNDKRTALVFGSDKTQVYPDFDKKKWYIKLSDKSLCNYTGFYRFGNYERVNFYTSPEKTAVDIMRKQAHIIKEIYRIKMKNGFRFFTENELAKIYYDWKNPPVFYSKKTPSAYFSTRDAYLLKAKETEIFDLAKEAVSNYRGLRPDTFWSRPYYIT